MGKRSKVNANSPASPTMGFQKAAVSWFRASTHFHALLPPMYETVRAWVPGVNLEASGGWWGSGLLAGETLWWAPRWDEMVCSEYLPRECREDPQGRFYHPRWEFPELNWYIFWVIILFPSGMRDLYWCHCHPPPPGISAWWQLEQAWSVRRKLPSVGRSSPRDTRVHTACTCVLRLQLGEHLVDVSLVPLFFINVYRAVMGCYLYDV